MNRRSAFFLLCWLLIGGYFVGGCASEVTIPEPAFPIVPAHLPTVVAPADNPVTPERAELGRHLFYDKNLSRDGSVACASCHRQEAAFSDGPNSVSVGVNEARGQRNAPMIVNAAYRQSQFWDGRAGSLEDQAMGAFTHPAEMFADTVAVADYIRTTYPDRWLQVFGDLSVTMRRAMQAIATFERTLVSANSRYDRYVTGDVGALSVQEQRGMRLFFSDRTMCASCHSGPDLTDDQFHNIGLFHHYFDRGRYNVTKEVRDEGLFRTPTLRNVALTPPYMATGDSEDGELNTLEQVMKHYNDGGTNFPNKDKRVRKLGLTEDEVADIVAFMRSLTDSSVITNPRFSRP